MDHDDENNENDVDDGNNDVECNVNNHNDDDHDNNNRLWEGNSGCRFVFYAIRDNNGYKCGSMLDQAPAIHK